MSDNTTIIDDCRNIIVGRLSCSLPLGWTTDKLKNLHNSVPANPLLAEPMYLTAYIERLGTGTTDILKFAKNAHLPEPKFIQEDMFRTIVYRKQKSQVTGQVTGQVTDIDKRLESNSNITRTELLDMLVEKVGSKLVESQIKILLLIGENTGISKRAMSETIKISTTAIDKNISKLKHLGILQRIGPAKGGYWQIIENIK